MSDPVVIPGGRDVRATRDVADKTAPTDALVVACPPHPHHGGSRHDRRLRAIAEALTGVGVDCLRIDYGAYDAGRGACVDVERAVNWACDRVERVGLVGYSFGAAVALCAAARGVTDTAAVDGVVALAPPTELPIAVDEGRVPSVDKRTSPEWNTVAALSVLTGADCAVDIVNATRDSTVETTPVAEATRAAGERVIDIDTDHGFISRLEEVTEVVTDAVDRWQ